MYMWGFCTSFSVVLCPAATWNMQFGRERKRSSEVACCGVDTSEEKVMLSEQFRLDSGK